MKLPFKKDNSAPAGRHRVVSGRQPVPGAFSYHAQRAERSDAPGRQQARAEAKPRPKLDFLLRRAGFIAGGVIILVCAVSLLSLSASPRIIVLSPDSGRYYLHSDQTYQQAAAAALKRSIWNRNKVTVNTNAVIMSLQKQFPELASVSVTLPLIGNRPIVYLQPTKPVFILAAANGSYVLGESGKVLLPATQLPADSTLDLPTITAAAVSPAQPGQGALTPAETAFIQTVLAELSARHVSIGAISLPAASEELDVAIHGQPYFVKFNLHDSGGARQQTGTFLAVQAKLRSENITPKQYIDVRVPGRAYYK